MTAPQSPSPDDREDPSNRARWFELFNEINIIAQLASAALSRRLPDGMHVSHFGVINHLYRLGDGRTPQSIASAFQVTKPTMTNTLAKLEQRGLINVHPNPEDGRSKLVYLTDAGRAFRAEAIATLDPLLDALNTHIDCEDAESVMPTLRKLRVYLDEHRR